VRLTSRVLVVDDSSTMRGIVRKVLAASRFPLDVAETADGLEALKLVRDSNFDLMFLDYNMPDFSGFETLSELRRERRRVDVVIMTAAKEEALEDRAREAGAAFLKKPFYPSDIDAVLCAFYGLRALNPNRK
jgi:DNA-binding response OmpR family regulator